MPQLKLGWIVVSGPAVLRDGAIARLEFIADTYGIADMAAYPWCLLWHRQGIVLDEFPNVKRWLGVIGERAAVQRAYAIGKELNTVPTVTDAAKSVLFGQGRR